MVARVLGLVYGGGTVVQMGQVATTYSWHSDVSDATALELEPALAED